MKRLSAYFLVCCITCTTGLTASELYAASKFGSLAISVNGESVGSNNRAGAVMVMRGKSQGLTSESNQLWHQDTPDIKGQCEPFDGFGSAVASGDFNNDGYPDLAVGAPYEDINTIFNAGMVHVVYGKASGLASENNQIWHQDSPGIKGVAEEEDQFGMSLTTGDFNNDGFDDLVVGSPFEQIDSKDAAGAINILYGSVSGLISDGNQMYYQDSQNIAGTSEAWDRFGSKVAVGDFNMDGYDDLAVGVPGEDIGSLDYAGAVNVIYGSEDGLTTLGNKLWHQDSPNIHGRAEARDYFGTALTTGDFDKDGFADLAIGAAGEAIGAVDDAGAVNVIYGSENGLAADRNQLWYQGHSGIEDTPEELDRFGGALAGGDFNKDGFDDLAIGVSGEGINSIAVAGAVQIIYGSGSGLVSAGNQFWHQDSPGIGGVAEVGDRFGASLVAADFNLDGYNDLAIGVPDEAIGSVESAGAVNIFLGSETGLTASGDQLWHQDSPGILDNSEEYDTIGFDMAYIPPKQPFAWSGLLPAILKD